MNTFCAISIKCLNKIYKPSRKMKTDEFNNYQDEMNVSLQLNVPSKSINLKLISFLLNFLEFFHI